MEAAVVVAIDVGAPGTAFALFCCSEELATGMLEAFSKSKETFSLPY